MMGSWWAAAVLIAQAAVAHSVVGVLAVPDGAVNVHAPVKIRAADGPEELGPVLTAASAIAVDLESGAVLFGRRPQQVRPLASITKLVSALVVLRRSPQWDARIEIIADDVPVEGGTRLRIGDRVTVADLLTLALVSSDNAAAHALARAHGVSAAEMESFAHALGARSVRIRDASGLDPENVGTASDVARIMRAAFAEPDIARRVVLPEVVADPHRADGQQIRAPATNLLLGDGVRHAFTLRGGKTGYLDEAGSNLVMLVERDGRQVAIVILGSASRDDRFRDARILADWVYRNYTW